MEQKLILYPLFGMVAITMMVWFKLLFDRVTEIKTKRIHPQLLASAVQVSQNLQNLRSADHLKNLFEVPILFYVLCLCLFVTQKLTFFMLVLAWTYVGLRGIQAYIHCSYNKVFHRFIAYITGSILLFCMWIYFAIQLF